MWDRMEKWSHALLFIVLGGGVLYLLLRYLLPILLPFLIAWGIAALILPLARRMHSRLGLSTRVSAAVLLTLFLSAGTLLVGWGISRLLSELRGLLEGWISEYGSFEALVTAWIERAESLVGAFGGGSAATDSPWRERLHTAFYELLTGVLSSLASGLSTIAGKWLSALPSILFTAVVTVLACFYFCMDSERIAEGLRRLIPQSIADTLPRMKRRARHVSRSYGKAYLTLLLITFAILFLGFTLLGVRYAFLLATLTAAVDLLPVLGVGTILLPWAVALLIGGRYPLAIGLLALYAVTILLRQIVEPRLVGKSLGLHPLLTVFVTYVGWRLFGILGMLLAPFFALGCKLLLTRE